MWPNSIFIIFQVPDYSMLLLTFKNANHSTFIDQLQCRHYSMSLYKVSHCLPYCLVLPSYTLVVRGCSVGAKFAAQKNAQNFLSSLYKVV